jgi:threonyl-tRNA synthetase
MLFLVRQYNSFKVHFIKDKVADGTSTTVYRCGPMIDLCVGPHIPHTGRVKSLAVLKVSQPSLALVTR